MSLGSICTISIGVVCDDDASAATLFFFELPPSEQVGSIDS
jgi:hypothetical protein